MTIGGYHLPAYPRLRTIEILGPERVSDGQGGWNTTFEPVASVEGRLMPFVGRQQSQAVLAGQEIGIVTHRAYLPPDTEITTENRLRLDGQEYRITAVMDAGGMGHHLTIDLLEVG